MVQAYVLFNVDAGSEDQVRKELKNIAAVQQVYVSYGIFDLISKITAESLEQLKEIVTYRLRTIHNVKSTLTLILS